MLFYVTAKMYKKKPLFPFRIQRLSYYSAKAASAIFLLFSFFSSAFFK